MGKGQKVWNRNRLSFLFWTVKIGLRDFNRTVGVDHVKFDSRGTYVKGSFTFVPFSSVHGLHYREVPQ